MNHSSSQYVLKIEVLRFNGHPDEMTKLERFFAIS
jgi:hypothetical protein